MGIVKKDALRTSVVSYIGLILGYVNKGFLFIIFLSTEEIGLINLLASVATLYAQFAGMGTFNTIWRFFPILERKDKNHHGFLTFNLLVVSVGAALIALISLIFSEQISAYYSQKSPLFSEYFLWVIPSGIAVLFFLLLDGYSRAIQRSVFATFANDVILRVLTTGIIFVYAFDWISFNTFVITVCLMQWVPTILVVLYFRFIGEWHFSVKDISIPSRLKRIMLHYSGFSYLNSMGTSVIITIDALMVAGMIGMSQTGVYTTITYITRALIIPYTAIMRVSAPLVPKFWKERDMKGMEELYQKVSSVALVIGLTLFLFVWVNRQELFELLPPEFKAGIYVFLFIMIGRMVDMYFGLNGTILITSKKYRYDIIFTALLLVIVVFLNFQLIPIWGMVGAAISTAIAYILFNLARVIFVYIHFRIHPFHWNHLKVSLVFALVLALFEFVPMSTGNIWLNMLLKSTLATLLFPMLIYVFNIEPEMVSYVKSVKAKLLKKKR